jgi:hypothetical protein
MRRDDLDQSHSLKSDPIRMRRIFQLFKGQPLAAGPELGPDFQNIVRIGCLEFAGTILDINFVQKDRRFRVVQLPKNSQNRLRLVMSVGNDSPGADDAQGDYYRDYNVFHITPLRQPLGNLAHAAKFNAARSAHKRPTTAIPSTTTGQTPAIFPLTIRA